MHPGGTPIPKNLATKGVDDVEMEAFPWPKQE